MRLIPAEHLAALTDPANWNDNPFAGRDAARDARRQHPLLSVTWTLVTMLVAAGGAWWLAHIIHTATRYHVGVPWMLGGSLGAMLCIAVCGVHAIFVSAAANRHTNLMIYREAWRSTLPSLLMLPLSPFQMLAQASIYPWAAAMRLALMGLPFYAACAALGGISWLDVAMLYVVFAGLAFTVPAWLRPALSEDAFVAQVAPGTATITTARAGQPGALANEQRLAQRSSGSAAALPILALVPFGFFAIALSSRRGGFGWILADARAYAPDTVLQLAPSFLLSWPLLLARVLITPFDWFGIPLPPLPLVAASFLLGRYLSAARSAEFLQVGTWRDLASLPTYLGRRLLAGRLLFARVLVMTGYLWKWAIVNGGISGPIQVPGGIVAEGLASLAFGTLVVAFARTGLRAGLAGSWLRGARPKGAAATRPAARVTTPATALRFVVAPLASAAAYYLLCCAFSRTWPFPTPVCAMAGKLIAIGLAGAVLNFAVNNAWPAVTFAGILILPFVLVAPAWARPLAALSPTLGALSLLDRHAVGALGSMLPLPVPLTEVVRSFPAWWKWPLSCLTGAALAGAWVVVVRRRRTPAEATEGEPHTILDPTRFGAEVFQDVATGPASPKEKPDTAAGLWVVSAVQRVLDNPVATKEMRARLRGRLGQRELTARAAVWGVLFVVAIGLPPGPAAAVGTFGEILYGRGLATPLAQSAAGILTMAYLIMLVGVIGLGMNLLATAFGPDRDKSTLGFVLTTPLGAPAILWGKAVGILLPSGSLLMDAVLWTLLVTAVAGPALGMSLALTVWAQAMLTLGALLLVCASVSLTVAAIWPRRVNAGCGGLFIWLAIQVVFQAFSAVLRSRGPLGMPTDLFGIGPFGIWLLFLAACLVVTALCIPLALWAVKRMRKGDIVFEAAKRAG